MNAAVDALLVGLTGEPLAWCCSVRKTILDSDVGMIEIVKWNSPSYTVDGHDVATLHLRPPTAPQIILHAGAKVTGFDLRSHVSDPLHLLRWRGGERAVMPASPGADLLALQQVIRSWLQAAQAARRG